MEKVKLSDICEILNGYAFKSSLYTESGLRIIRITNVQNGYIEDYEPKFYDIDKKEELSNYVLKENDLLISLTGNVGRVALLKKELLPAVLNQRVGCIRIKNESILNKKYLFNMLNNKIFECACINNSKGIAQKNLSTEWLKEYKINLPNIKEQEKIANELDKIHDIIDMKVKQIDDLDKLIKSQFVEMFGNPVLNEKNWFIQKLSELGCFKNGMNFNKKDNGYKIKFLGVGEFKNRTLINDVNQLQDLNLLEKPNYEYLLKDKDIIFVRSNGSKELVGRSILVENLKEEATYSGFCIRYRNESKMVNVKFLIELFQNTEFKESLKKDSRGANINNINQQMLSNLQIILPPIELQNKFAEYVKLIDKQKFEIQKSLEEMKKLQESLMNKYFRE